MKPSQHISFVFKLIVILTFISSGKFFCQDFNFKWGAQLSSPEDLEASAVCIDKNGNIISAGTWVIGIDFEYPNMVDTASNNIYRNNIYITKRDFYGNYIWGIILKSNGSDHEIADIETDQFGNIYIIGSGASIDLDPSPTDTALLVSGKYFLAKYDHDGNYLWSVPISTTGGIYSVDFHAIELDDQNNVYITGGFSGPIDFDPDTSILYASGSSNSTFVAKYSSSGDVLDMHYFYSPGAYKSYTTDMAVDKNENVYITGRLLSNYFFINGFMQGGGSYLQGKGFGDIFLIKLNSDLDPEWYFSLGTSDAEAAFSLAIDDSANVYITGGFGDPIDMDPDTAGVWMLYNPTNSFNNDAFIAKYDSTGSLKWAKEFSGMMSEGKSIDLDEANNIYVGLVFNDSVWLNPGVDSLSIYTPANGVAIVKLNPSGVAVDAGILHGGGQLISQANMDADPFGNLALTSRFYFPIDLDVSPDSSIYNAIDEFDSFTAFYSPCRLNADSIINSTHNFACFGDSIYLSVDSTLVNSVLWSNGDTTFSTYYDDDTTEYVIIDSVCIFYLYNEIYPNITTQTATVCNEYTWSINGQTYTSSGSYSDTATVSGCESITVLNLTINGYTYGNLDTTACNSYTVPSGDETYYSSGIYSDTLINSVGCDSILSINLTLYNASYSDTTVVACNDFTWQQNGINYTNSGVYLDTITNAVGCDSIIALNLSVNNTSLSQSIIAACDNYTWTHNGITYTNSGIYSDTLVNMQGCDSIVQLYLTINYVTDISTSVNGTLITANNGNATYQWLDCDNNYIPLSGETNQIFTASSNGSYAVEISQFNCTDTSDCVSIISANILESNFNSSILVSPNPSQRNFLIDLGMNLASVYFTLTDINGKLIESGEYIDTQKLNLTINEPEGVYLLTLVSGENRALIRLIKK